MNKALQGDFLRQRQSGQQSDDSQNSIEEAQVDVAAQGLACGHVVRWGYGEAQDGVLQKKLGVPLWQGESLMTGNYLMMEIEQDLTLDEVGAFFWYQNG